jgi:hypothetical protein
MDLAAMTPCNELASSTYCLANPGREYLVYLPDDSQVAVNLSAAKGKLAVEWFNPRTGETTAANPVPGGGRWSFIAPIETDAVLYLYPIDKQ